MLNDKEEHYYTEVYAWGSNTSGQLGISTQGVGKNYPKPKYCSFNIVLRQISCGDEHTAMITSTLVPILDEGFVYAMGSNGNGRLGVNSPLLTHSAVPRLVEGLTGYVMSRVACGWTHTVGVTSNARLKVDGGEVFTWGLGEFGALGHGDTVTRYVPAKVRALEGKGKVVLAACGRQHSVFLYGKSSSDCS